MVFFLLLFTYLLYSVIKYKTSRRNLDQIKNDVTKSTIEILGENGINHQLECPILCCIDNENIPEFNESDAVSTGVLTLVPEYAAILPIRILRLKVQNAPLWNRVDLLMDHVNDLDPDQKNRWMVSEVIMKT